MISSEANEISEKEAKKTIACDHITKALEQLGFSEYVPAVLEAAAEHKEVQKVRSRCQFFFYPSFDIGPHRLPVPSIHGIAASIHKGVILKFLHRGGRRRPTSSPVVV